MLFTHSQFFFPYDDHASLLGLQSRIQVRLHLLAIDRIPQQILAALRYSVCCLLRWFRHLQYYRTKHVSS